MARGQRKPLEQKIGAIIESSNLSMEEVERILSEHASHVA